MTKTVCARLMNQNAVYWLALTSLLVGFFVWGATHLGGFAWDFDEGLNLMKARTARLGYRLYSEIWSDQPPALTLFLAVAFKLFGDSVAMGRLVAVLFSSIGLLGIALITRELGGQLGSLAAVAILVTASCFFKLSRAVMIGLPAISLATLSIAFAFYYLRTGKWQWLALAGGVFSASLLMKLMITFVVVPLALTTFLRRGASRSWMGITKDLGMLILTVVTPILPCLVVYDGQVMFDQVIGTYLKSKDTLLLDITCNLREICHYFKSNYGLLALASYGTISLLLKRSRSVLIIISWLILTLVILVTHSPLWRHHFILLLFPLAILGGVAISQIWHRLPQSLDQPFSQRMFLLLGLVALSLYLFELPKTIRADQGLLSAPGDEVAQEVVSLLKRITKPEDFVMTDELMIAFRAGRKVPPSLCVPSAKRIVTGNLTLGELITTTKEYDARVVLTWSGRFAMLPEYIRWVKTNYRLVKSYDDQHQIYQKRPPVERPGLASLGDCVIFLGYDLGSATVEPGGKLHLTLYWGARCPIDASYTVFTHLIDAQGRIWGQWDNPPMKGNYLTTHWSEDEVIPDEYEIPLKPDAPPGEYQVEVGMYLLETVERLPTGDEEGRRLPENRILLEQVIVVQ